MGKRIEICGGIAAGKTSLTRILEEEGFTTIYERFNDNPFLNEFYASNEVDNTFETEMVFALLHYNWIKAKKDETDIICDYSLVQDYCYGVNNLKKTEMEVFNNMYSYLINQISCADLLIYLKCDVECLLERIKRRGREMEQKISREYLQSNIVTLEKCLCEKRNVMIIESDKYNFIEKDRELVVKKVKDFYLTLT